jgi:hypothetical protein
MTVREKPLLHPPSYLDTHQDTLGHDGEGEALYACGNALPLEIFGMTTSAATPVLFALGTLTTLFPFPVIVCARWSYGSRGKSPPQGGAHRETESWRQSRCWIIRCCGTS